jgi:hypothetical protein
MENGKRVVRTLVMIASGPAPIQTP